MASTFYSLCNPIIVGCKLYQNNGATTPSIDGFYSNGTDCYQVSGGFGEVSAISVCPPLSHQFVLNSGTTCELACKPIVNILANNLFGFGKQDASWANAKTSTSATAIAASGVGQIESAFFSGEYHIYRTCPIFDTTTITTLPTSGTLSFYITANSSAVALTYHLIASNVVYTPAQILGLDDWNNFNGSNDGSAVPISSVVVNAGQVGRVTFTLDSTALNAIKNNGSFSAYMISTQDKNNTPPAGNPFVPMFSLNSGNGVSGSGDGLLRLQL